MYRMARTWDYLIVTASNEEQAAAYQSQLDIRIELDLLPEVNNVLVVPDPGGSRIGSGGSTVYSLLKVIERESSAEITGDSGPEEWLPILGSNRILIIHAGGDSRRLPTYGPVGKIFTPMPVEGDSILGMTLFDLQIGILMDLPPLPDSTGQIVITSGDSLLIFNPGKVEFAGKGLTGLGSYTSPDEASRHGVYCVGLHNRVRFFMQKPSIEELYERGAVDREGRAILDIGVFSFDAQTAVALLNACQVTSGPDGTPHWKGKIGRAIEAHGLDFYREICCALGEEATFDHYFRTVLQSGSTWSETQLRNLFESISDQAFSLQVLKECEFYHFGTSRQLISSGFELREREAGENGSFEPYLCINTKVGDEGAMNGDSSWIEGCLVNAPLNLGGDNVVVGVNITQPLSLQRGACVDVIPGTDRNGADVWFVRCYSVADSFKTSPGDELSFCGMKLDEWLSAVGVTADLLWDDTISPEERSLWNARIFPAAAGAEDHIQWLWILEPSTTDDTDRRRWLNSDRYSLEEISRLVSPDLFHERREGIRLEQIAASPEKVFNHESGFSAADLALLFRRSQDPTALLIRLLQMAKAAVDDIEETGTLRSLNFSRIIHSIGSAIVEIASNPGLKLDKVFPGLPGSLPRDLSSWLDSIALTVNPDTRVSRWIENARGIAFKHLERTVITGSTERAEPLRAAMNTGGTAIGRAPARLDLGGGWTDTPPYAFENGGRVINAAVDLNGEPPVKCKARIIRNPVIRLESRDAGTRIEISTLDQLLDYKVVTSEFSLSKAALALSGFSHESASWPESSTLQQMLEYFGGGIELSTHADIPQGSGLGTSSIMGAVILATVKRLMGETPTQRELFNDVLRLEQALTTGGGWQDQIGGVIGGVKLISTEPGIVPDAHIEQVPPDVLDQSLNRGRTLLYYTGITRLAKDILHQVVGRYLDRNRSSMNTLRRLHDLPLPIAESMRKHDLEGFGILIKEAWRLNNQLDPDSSNAQIEALFKRIAPHVHGAKLLGAGGGGFLLMVCKSEHDAAAIWKDLIGNPQNEHAKFYDFEVNEIGLEVSVDR